MPDQEALAGLQYYLIVDRLAAGWNQLRTAGLRRFRTFEEPVQAVCTIQ